jgi:hypothetical protein
MRPKPVLNVASIPTVKNMETMQIFEAMRHKYRRERYKIYIGSSTRSLLNNVNVFSRTIFNRWVHSECKNAKNACGNCVYQYTLQLFYLVSKYQISSCWCSHVFLRTMNRMGTRFWGSPWWCTKCRSYYLWYSHEIHVQAHFEAEGVGWSQGSSSV